VRKLSVAVVVPRTVREAVVVWINPPASLPGNPVYLLSVTTILISPTANIHRHTNKNVNPFLSHRANKMAVNFP